MLRHAISLHWLAETLRLREVHQGPLSDSAEVRRARASVGNLADMILHRAAWLGKREQLDTTLKQWTIGARWALVLMMAGAVFLGAGAAMGVLGNGLRPVNIILALTAALGLHAITFVLWLLTFLPHAGKRGAWLGQCWLWVTRKLARGPNASLAPRALAGVLERNGSLPWALGAISHGLWSITLCSLLATMLALLSTRRYTFVWETTLLSPETFVHLTHAIGWLPGLIGFSMPAADIVRASNGLDTVPASAQALWSAWLIGAIVVYGLVPRLAALALSVILTLVRLRSLRLDSSLPGYAELRQRLTPTSERGVVDGPAGPLVVPRAHSLPADTPTFGRTLAVALELPSDTSWPPATLPPGMVDAGVVDSRAQRNALLDRLASQPAHHVLIACDARQTPDRSALAFIGEIAGLAHTTQVVLLDTAPAPNDANPPSRAELWAKLLDSLGLDTLSVHTSLDGALHSPGSTYGQP